MEKSDFTIKDEFKNLIPPPTDEEVQILEEQILKDGVRHPLTVWKEQNILIDGHTRLSICKKHNLPYQVEYLSFPDEDYVISWMSNNQLGRRNITEAQKTYLLGKLYETEKKIHGGQGKNQYSYEKGNLQSDETHHSAENTSKPHNTRKKIADEQGVSLWAVQKARDFSKSVDSLAVISPEIKTEILSGKVKIPKRELDDMALIAQSEPEIAIEQYKEFKMGKKKKKTAKKQKKSEAVKRSSKSLMANILHNNMMPDVMDKAYRDFAFELQKARDGEWVTVSKESVTHFVNKLIAIIEE